MTELIIVLALALVAVGGTVVVRTGEPSAQAVALGGYGLLLAVLFVVLQAPDVALSQVTVGSAVVPLMVLLTIRAIGRHRGERR
jgi:energy-converting hydrogenase B subunit D